MTATTTATGIAVPEITDDMSTLDAAYAYAKAGFYIGPCERRSKHPGSLLGDDWNLKTSRDVQVITSWFAGTDYGLFIHAGRSGPWIADIDNPAKIHPKLQQAIAELGPPYQSTRTDQPGRGHFLFQQAPGRDLGNSLGQLKKGWGEGRGRNGVIIVQPSEHQEEGGRYQWLHTGPVPMLPGYVANLLPDTPEASDAATDAQVAAFLAEHRESERPGLLGIQLTVWQRKVRAGDSRHDTVMGHITGAMQEAAAGLLDAQLAADTFQSVFESTVMQQPAGPKQGKARSLAEARDEWRGILAWAVAQARAADPAETRARVEREVPSDPLEGLVPPHARPSTNGSTPPPQDDPASQRGGAEALSLILPESFYESRPSLRMIRGYAHSRGAAADPVLYNALARISGMVPHQCRLETGIGGSRGASLNLFAAAIGPSGTGKSTGSDVAKDVCPIPIFLDFVDELPLGSGEGIAEAFMGSEEQDTGEVYQSGDKKGEPKKKAVRCQVRHNAFIEADEGEMFTKLQERSGSTLGSTIRTAWYGGTLGNTNADPTRNRKIPGGSYSLGMFIGFQPETALPLLADMALGTTQRFVYCSTIDPTKPEDPAFCPAPPPRQLKAPASKMRLDVSIAAEVRRHNHAHSTGAIAVPPLDAHKNLTKLKLAALLAMHDERQQVDESDWHLAGIMWDTSCRVRDHYLAQAASAAAREKASRTQDYVDREGLAEGARQQARDVSAKVARLGRLLGKYVHDPIKPSRTVADAVHRLRSEDRLLGGAALDYAITAGWVIHDGSALSPGDSMPSEGGR